jgi:spore coat polysaccharide biosynthesis protein SpsF
MKTVCIVQARMGSTRLPGKVLLPLNGHTVIGEVLTRCKRIPGVDEVVCAIPESDEPLAKEAAKYAWVFRGPEQDVLARYHGAAIESGADMVMRITGDCPLLSPDLCWEVIKMQQLTGAEYCSNVCPRTFPQGLDCEVFTMALLEQAQQVAGPHEREHVTTWMRGDNDIHRYNVESPWLMDGRLTLDTWDDYKTICAAFGHEAPEHLRAA